MRSSPSPSADSSGCRGRARWGWSSGTGILFLLLSLTRFREEVIRAIPDPLKTGIQAGIGLFIIVIGLKNLGLFGDPAPSFIALRPASPDAIELVPLVLAAVGCGIALVLLRLGVAGAILLAILAIAGIGLFVTSGGNPVTPAPEGFVSLPPSPLPVLLQADWFYPFRNWNAVWVAVLTLFFVDLFDSLGTLIGVCRRAGLVDKNGNLPRIRPALAADAAATSLGAAFGVSTTTAYIESATGVESGGRTGLTAVITATCFLLALFFYPLIAVIPAAAVAPALLLVGGIMMKGLVHLKGVPWQALAAAIAIVVLIPLNFQIAEGIAAGCVCYTVLMTVSGKWRQVHWLLAVLSGLFAVKFAHDLLS